MFKIRRPIIVSAVVGFGLGVAQIVRDNAATWHATNATYATVALQTGGGGLIGAAFLAALMAYWRLAGRSRPSGSRAPVSKPKQTGIGMQPPTPVRYGPRQAIVLMFGLVLLILGGIVLKAALAHPTIYGVVRGGGGAVFLIGLGGYLLWDDFIAPYRAGRARLP